MRVFDPSIVKIVDKFTYLEADNAPSQQLHLFKGCPILFRKKRWAAWERGWFSGEWIYDGLMVNVQTFEGLSMCMVLDCGDQIAIEEPQ